MMLFLFAVLFHLFLYWPLEFFSYPEFHIYPYLVNRGLIPYRQIIDQHFPALTLTGTNFYSLGFTDPLDFKKLALLLILVQSVFIFKSAGKLRLKGRYFSVFAFALWQIYFAGNHLWYDSFVGFFAVIAFYYWLGRKYFVSGLLLGAAVLFKQSALILPLFLIPWAAVCSPGRLKTAFRFAAGVFLPVAALFYWVYSRGVFDEFWFWTIEFNWLYYPTLAFSPPSFRAVLYLISPALVVVSSLIYQNKRTSVLFPVVWAGLLVLSGFTRVDRMHFQAAVPFLSLITGVLAADLYRYKRIVFYALSAFLIAVFGRYYFRQSHFFQYRFFDSASLRLAQSISRRVPAGDKTFLLGVQPHLYVLSGTLPSGSFFVYQLPWYLHLTGDRMLADLALDPPRYIFFDTSAVVDKVPVTEYTRPLLQFIRRDYRLMDKIGDVEVYESRY